MAAKILVVDDEPDIREILSQSLQLEGYEVSEAVDGRDAITQFQSSAADLVITDMRMPHADGLDVLRAVKSHDPLVEVIVLTGYATLNNAVSALKNEGAFNYLTKPLEDIEEILTAVRNALERQLLRRQNQTLLDRLRANNHALLEKTAAAEAARTDLERALERNTSLVNAIPSGILELDTAGTISYANASCHTLFGLPQDTLPGRSVYELVEDNGQGGTLRDEIRRLISDTPEPTPWVTTGRTAAGDALDLQVDWSYQRDGAGAVAGFIAVITDITTEKRASDERLQLEKHLASAKRREAISTLAGGIAHRFNNALAALVGNLELLEMVIGQLPDTATYINRIKGQTNEMAMQTQKLLAYAQGGKYRSKYLNLVAFIRESLPIIRYGMAEDRSIAIESAEDELSIKVDPTQLELVLSALIQNAFEATDANGSIRIATARSAAAPMSLAETAPGPYASLRIEDDGRGMDAQTLDRLFEPYFSTKFEGRGLGMAAVQGIINNHHGSIDVTSRVGQGTVITIYLPIDEAPEPETPAPLAPASLEGFKLLIIEDEPALLSACEAMLSDLGCRVWSAPNAASGIQQLEAHRDEIDLVLMDLILPDMGAMALFKALREIRPDLRVVLCSGYSIDGPAQAIIDAGALSFLQKPYSTKALVAALMRASEQAQ
ncbi:MAG: response regulator [Desulfosarcinaceae bacterium]|nr:response regulator [Desulfosarcinaceae bacterium]